MKKLWISNEKCTGCAACANACPFHAIHMVENISGFLYPEITDACRDCGLCEKTCLERTISRNRSGNPSVYAGWAKNADIRYESTSGGAFSLLAEEILRQGGVVASASYDYTNKRIYHKIIENISDLPSLRQSKYAQSEIGEVYQQFRVQVERGIPALFCGTPCQVAGLYSYLGKEYENLVSIDFICRGVNSPKAFTSWLNELESESGSNLSRVWFKYKESGWRASPFVTRIDFENGATKVLDIHSNNFMRGYLMYNLYMRPSCGNCDFKQQRHASDITLGDFWGIEDLKDDDLGTSLIQLNSEKGHALFDIIRERMVLSCRRMDETSRGNVCADHSVDLNPQSKSFLASLDTSPFSQAINRYEHPSIYEKAIRKIRRMLNTK